MLEPKLREIRKKLTKERLDGVLISSVSNITYLTGYANFSEREREAYLIVGGDFQYIITDGRYTDAIKKQITHFTLLERNHQTPTEKLFESLKKRIKRLGFEEDNLTVSEYKLVKKHFKTKHFKTADFRSIKNSDEIKKIEKACQIGDLAFDYILKKIKVGVTEEEVALELENFVRSQKGKISFPPIVAFGGNCAIPHHQTGDKRLTINDKLILMDFGVKWENYCSDMTRTIFFGKPSKRQEDIYYTVVKAQQEAVDFLNSSIKSGQTVRAAQVDKVARKYITSKGYPSIPHSLGHGIGLEVHEHPFLSPKSKETLKEGMVFSIEPGIYLSGFGGVRIEDLLVYEKEGLRQITTSSKNLIKV